MRQDKSRKSVELRRGIVDTFTHEQALLCFRALNAFASVLAVADSAFPNRDQRTMAESALALAEDFRTANQVRDFLTDES